MSNEVTDLDQVALGLLGETKVRHGSSGMKPLLQIREHGFAVLHPAGCHIVEAGLEVAPEGR